jgi:2-polyprenyl-3-methyl-5-hydroxy-6-metoxy-1,4-benzoquinol methylase
MDRLEVTINTFDKYADQYQEKYMKYEPYIETYRYLSSLLNVDAEVLDVACGPGNISQFLLEKKPQLKIHGIDLSPQMVDLARLNNPTAVFEVRDSREISSLKKSYDAIVAGFCLPYLSKEEVVQFIIDVRAIVRTGGVLYISTMEDSYENSGYQSNNNVDRVYTYYYQAEYLLEQLKSVGFEIIDVDRKPFKSDEESKEAVDLFIYARAC